MKCENILLRRLIILVVVSFCCMPFSIGQVIIPGGVIEDYNHLLYLKNDLERKVINKSIQYGGYDSLSWDIWNLHSRKRDKVQILSPEARLSYNSTYPRGFNDGPIWKGRGITGEVHAGVQGDLGIFKFSINPALQLSQNQDFTLAPQESANISIFNNQFNNGTSGGIDFVQRYGNNSFARLYPSQSELRLSWKKATLAVSTQNFSFGPARFNPILMSNNGVGIPHIELGTDGPWNLQIKNIDLGKISTSLYYGLLFESNYFDTDPDNNRRYFTALTINYQIPYVDGLSIGASRIFYQDLQNFQTRDLGRTTFYFSNRDNITLPDGRMTNDFFDQMASVDLEWKFQEVGLRTYFEFAKGDFNGDFRDFLIDPDHTRAYTIGLEKVFGLKDHSSILFSLEHTNLSRSRSFLTRATPSYYRHFLVRQGYTNDGQIVGAGIGPGSSTVILNLKWFHRSGSIGGSFQQWAIDDDYFLANFSRLALPDPTRENRQAEYSFSGNATQFFGDFILSADLIWSKRFNYYYVAGSDRENVYLSLAARYRLK